MFKIETRNKGGLLRAKAAGKAVAAVGAACMVLGSATASLADQSCDVTIEATNTTTLNALQIDVDYAGVGATIIGCTFTPAGLTSVHDNGNDTATLAWADNTTAFHTPSIYAVCNLVAPGNLVAGDFGLTVVDATVGPLLEDAVPQPTMQVTDVTCEVASSCSLTPLGGCKQSTAPGKNKLQLKDDIKNPASDAKDQGQFQWKKGAATDVSEFGDLVNGTGSVSWCVYDAGSLIKGVTVPAGGTCDGKPCWKATGTSGFGYKSKNGDVGGVAGIKLKAGADTKAQVQVKAKSKVGNYSSPDLPLIQPVESQVVVDDGVNNPVCFSVLFNLATKNEDKQYQAK